MVALSLLFAAAFSGLAVAWPEPIGARPLDQRAIDCSKVNGALSVLKKLGPPATTFCSSFLKVPGTKTLTTTVTPATITSTTSTTTITVTSLSCGQAKRDELDLELAKPTDAVVNLDKRTAILPLLAAFAAPKISEGCSCLGLQPKATATATFTAATPTTNVIATATQCVVSQPVCKASGLSGNCVQDAECCSGKCGASFDANICCNASNEHCNLSHPDTCCSGICIGAGKNNNDGYCQ